MSYRFFHLCINNYCYLCYLFISMANATAGRATSLIESADQNGLKRGRHFAGERPFRFLLHRLPLFQSPGFIISSRRPPPAKPPKPRPLALYGIKWLFLIFFSLWIYLYILLILNVKMIRFCQRKKFHVGNVSQKWDYFDKTCFFKKKKINRSLMYIPFWIKSLYTRVIY